MALAINFGFESADLKLITSALFLLILVLGLAFRDPMLALLGATDDTWQYASDFYTLIIVGSPFIIVSTCCAPKATPCSP